MDQKARAAALILLVLLAGLLAWSAYVATPTLNEPGHLIAGLRIWQTGRFDIYRVNPPLVRMIAAVPVLLSGVETDWSSYNNSPGARPEFSLGEEFIAANGGRSLWVMTLARWVCIPFASLGGWVCFLWARKLYGPSAGLLSLALWCFCPNILAHGALITSDAASAAFAAAAGYTFWRWLKQPTWRHTVMSGVMLGGAAMTKTTLLVFYPLWPILWVGYRWPEWRLWHRPREAHVNSACPQNRHVSRPVRELGMLAVLMVIGIYAINLGYGFERTCLRLGDFRFFSATLGAERGTDKPPAGDGNRFAGTWLASLPVPLPESYVQGIDLQKCDFEHWTQPSYLHGQMRDRGWWYFYLYALAIKVPLGTWVLIGLAATRGVWRRVSVPPLSCGGPLAIRDERRSETTLRDELILLAPAVVILILVSSQTGFSAHMRYVLPIFPFVFVWIGRVLTAFGATRPLSSCGGPSGPSPVGLVPPAGRRQYWLTGALVSAALAWSICSSVCVYPHSLSYFNEIVGGPRGGPEHLAHSNLDWGQDLVFLKKWLASHPQARPLRLAYYGYFDPKDAGIEYTAVETPVHESSSRRGGQRQAQFGANTLEYRPSPESPDRIPPGWYAISVNFVRGLPYFSYKGDGRKTLYAKNELAPFQKLKPVAMAGYSIYIYHVREGDEPRPSETRH